VRDPEFVDVAAVRVLGDGYKVQLHWADGTVSTVDLEPYLWGPALAPARDPAVFATVQVDPDAGTICWPSTGADISPEELRRAGHPTPDACRPR